MSDTFGYLQQGWPLPARKLPITIIGAGGIVGNAHLPAYRKWGFEVAGIYDRNLDAAGRLAADFDIGIVHETLESAVASGAGGVFDLALPPQALSAVLPALPDRAVALIQKPLGMNLAEAKRLAALIAAGRLTAAINFQLRFTPSVLAVHNALEQGLLGEIVDIEVRLACRTPWQNWPFMRGLDHIEIPLHSVHYLDWIRAELGLPRSVYAKSLPHPDYPGFPDARSSIILDFGDATRCCLSLNHTHKWGPEQEEGAIRIEGTRGAAIIGLGYNLNFPTGVPEFLDMIVTGGQWERVPLAGARTPDSFAAVMSNLQRFAAGEDAELVTDIASSVATMALVDACIRSSDSGTAVTLDPV